MSSDSDSDEQFESADEDLDFDIEEKSPQSNIHHDVTKQVAQLSLKESSVQETKYSKLEENDENKITPSEKNSQPISDKINVSKIQDSHNESNCVEIVKEQTSTIEIKSFEHVSNSFANYQESSLIKNDGKSNEEGEDKINEPKAKEKSFVASEEPKYENVSSIDKGTEQSSTVFTSQNAIPNTKSPDITEKEPNISKADNDNKSNDIKEKESNTSVADNQSGDIKIKEKVDSKSTDIKAKEPHVDFEIDGWDVDIEDVINDCIPSTQGSELPTSNIPKNKGQAGDQREIHSSQQDRSVKKTPNEDFKSKFHLKEERKDVNAGADTDGWDVDVEVEDGFEIPVDLNKSSGSSQTMNDRFPFSLTSPLHKLTDSKEDSWGGWGAWGGVGNILSTATSGVSTLTSQVSQGFTQVLGAPDPAELAKQLSHMEAHQQQHNADQSAQTAIPEPLSTTLATESASTGGLFSLSQLTRLVETTGSKVIAGGLDTLENLGKKTMEVLQEGDPGLKKKRAILFPNQDKPVLSQVLRDAKSRHETQDKKESQESMSTPLSLSPGPNTLASVKTLHFETLLDDYQGLSHLEALEILSKQCSVKLHNALMSCTGEEQDQQMNDYQETLQQIREMCQVDDATDIDDNDEDEEDVMGFEEKIEEIVRLYDLSSKLNCDKLVKVNKKIVLQVDRLPLESSCDKLYSQCLHSMAEFTSIAMELFHKSASLLLLKSKHRTVDETDALTQLTYLLCSRITKLSSVYSQSMMTLDPDSPLITNVYLEAANSCSYLQDASQLLIPVLQIVAIPGGSS
ncbi:hypothetical protein WDU94_011416 [Cyamophila willieti]